MEHTKATGEVARRDEHIPVVLCGGRSVNNENLVVAVGRSTRSWSGEGLSGLVQ